MIRRILVIDDEENFCKMIKISLENAGDYQVAEAYNAESGLEKLREGEYDLVFLDILMPKIEGHIALQQIRRESDVPVVVMSAYIPPQRKSAIIQAGAYTCLEKPVELSQILQTIQEIEELR